MISRAFFDPGVATAYVTTGTNFPDALAGSAAAGVNLGGPVLLVRPNSIPTDVAVEMARLEPKTIVILGGTTAVSSQVETSRKTYGDTVRVAGANRFVTAALISSYAFASADAVYVSTGLNFPDALAGGPAAIQAGGPILLVDPDSIPGSVKNEISRLGPSQIHVLGGPAAVSDAVFTQLQSLAPTVIRIAGADRYSTATAVSATTFPSADLILIATGESFPDALAGGPVAGVHGGPILLVQRDGVPVSTQTEIERLTGEACSP